jgi:hypothetical protein
MEFVGPINRKKLNSLSNSKTERIGWPALPNAAIPSSMGIHLSSQECLLLLLG